MVPKAGELARDCMVGECMFLYAVTSHVLCGGKEVSTREMRNVLQTMLEVRRAANGSTETASPVESLFGEATQMLKQNTFVGSLVPLLSSTEPVMRQFLLEVFTNWGVCFLIVNEYDSYE